MQERATPVPICPPREVIYLNLNLGPHIIYVDVRNDPRPTHLRSMCRQIPKGSGAWRVTDTFKKQGNGHSLNGSASLARQEWRSAIAERLRALGLLERQVAAHIANIPICKPPKRTYPFETDAEADAWLTF
jgi:hypothetical protein